MPLKSLNKDVLHVFDVCGTLYTSNTTYDFYKFYFKRNNRKKYILFKLCFSLPAKIVWKIMSILHLSRHIRSFLIGFIKNESVDLVFLEAENFVKINLSKNKIPKSFSLLNKAISEDSSNVYLVSASIFPIINAISKENKNIPFFATELQIKDNHYTGKIIEDLERIKLKTLKSEGLINPNTELYVYTDSLNDSDLVNVSHKAYIVCGLNEQNKWKDKFGNKNLIFSNDI